MLLLTLLDAHLLKRSKWVFSAQTHSAVNMESGFVQGVSHCVSRALHKKPKVGRSFWRNQQWNFSTTADGLRLPQKCTKQYSKSELFKSTMCQDSSVGEVITCLYHAPLKCGQDMGSRPVYDAVLMLMNRLVGEREISITGQHHSLALECQ